MAPPSGQSPAPNRGVKVFHVFGDHVDSCDEVCSVVDFVAVMLKKCSSDLFSSSFQRWVSWKMRSRASVAENEKEKTKGEKMDLVELHFALLYMSTSLRRCAAGKGSIRRRGREAAPSEGKVSDRYGFAASSLLFTARAADEARAARPARGFVLCRA